MSELRVSWQYLGTGFDIDGLLCLSSSLNSRLLFLNMPSAACSLCTNILDAALRRLHCQAAFEKKLPLTAAQGRGKKKRRPPQTHTARTHRVSEISTV